MDRNVTLSALAPKQNVALRKESVDRNFAALKGREKHCQVALRKESVDRNRNSQYSYFLYYGSLSARRAWIEISNHQSVNYTLERRSPQGERG